MLPDQVMEILAVAVGMGLFFTLVTTTLLILQHSMHARVLAHLADVLQAAQYAPRYADVPQIQASQVPLWIPSEDQSYYRQNQPTRPTRETARQTARLNSRDTRRW